MIVLTHTLNMLNSFLYIRPSMQQYFMKPIAESHLNKMSLKNYYKLNNRLMDDSFFKGKVIISSSHCEKRQSTILSI